MLSLSVTRRPHFSPPLAVFLFMFCSTALTIVAFFAFSRAYDHQYFSDLANSGIAAAALSGIDIYDLKTKAIATVFYALSTPSRLLGGADLLHVVWLRLFTLFGVLKCFEWVVAISRTELGCRAVSQARNRFLFLFLLYPGQIAWSASLLRDGPAASLLFVGLYCWIRRQRFLSLVLMFSSIALRPEYVVVLAILYITVYMTTRFQISGKNRIFWLFGLLALISVVTFERRAGISEFSQLAFEEGGAAYPAIGHLFDVPGYFQVFLQGVLDPISLSDIGSLTPFFVAECVFYIWLLITGYRRLARVNYQTAGILVGIFVSMWIFAYFEVFVSGFSRHRMGLTVMLIAVVALPTKPRARVV